MPFRILIFFFLVFGGEFVLQLYKRHFMPFLILIFFFLIFWAFLKSDTMLKHRIDYAAPLA